MSAAAGSGAKQSSGCCGLCALNDYRKKAGLSCSFIIFAALNIAMVYNGAENIQRCPAEPMIPVYLLVAGSTSLALLMVRLIVSHVLMPQLINKSESGGPEDFPLVRYLVHGLKVFDTLASVFSTCWLIAGSIYVYRAHVSYDVGQSNFCNYGTYVFAFVVITIGYISLCLSVLAAICAVACRSVDDEE